MTGTTVIPLDNTKPQITEGVEVITCAVTPAVATSKLVIEADIFASSSATGTFAVALFQDTTADALAVTAQVIDTVNTVHHFRLTYVMSTGATTATTFKIRAGNSSAGTWSFNGAAGAALFAGTLISRITVKEMTV